MVFLFGLSAVCPFDRGLNAEGHEAHLERAVALLEHLNLCVRDLVGNGDFFRSLGPLLRKHLFEASKLRSVERSLGLQFKGVFPRLFVAV